MATPQTFCLSEHDQLVLGTMFDTELGGVASTPALAKASSAMEREGPFDNQTGVFIDPNLSLERFVPEDQVTLFQSIERKVAAVVNEVQPQQEGAVDQLQAARTTLETEILAHTQVYSSVYNNLAQIDRYLLLLNLKVNPGTDPKLKVAKPLDVDLTSLNYLTHLEQAITALLLRSIALAHPEGSLETDPVPSWPIRRCRVSPHQARCLGAAYGQLAALQMDRAARFEGLLAAFDPSTEPAELKPFLDAQFTAEVGASGCLARAAFFGDHFTAGLAPRVNPYAKTCGRIVKEALCNPK